MLGRACGLSFCGSGGNIREDMYKDCVDQVEAHFEKSVQDLSFDDLIAQVLADWEKDKEEGAAAAVANEKGAEDQAPAD